MITPTELLRDLSNLDGTIAQLGARIQRSALAVPWVRQNLPAEAAAHEALIGRMSKYYNTLAGLQRGIAAAKAAGKSLVDYVAGFFNLGALQLIPAGLTAAAIIAAFAGARKVLADADEMDKRIELAKDAIARGVSPDKAAALLERPGLFDNLKTVGIMALAGLVIFWAMSRGA